jgi:hypothetical protein
MGTKRGDARRFRNSFSKPEPFVNKKTAVNIKLQDVMHTFKRDIKSKSNSKYLVSFN